MMALVALVIGYLLGSVPFGLIVTRHFGLGDVRAIGSGNIGATNVLRTGHKGAAAATLALDMAKGAAAVLLARWMVGETAALWAGLGAFLGHLFPVWLGFRGGKGMATFLGVVLAVCFPAGLVACATWLIAAWFGRISSLSALVASLVAPLWLGLLHGSGAATLGAALMILVWARHHQNIARLVAGEEAVIGA